MGKLERRFPRYSKLLSLYPLTYRSEYNQQMLQTLADMLDNHQHSRASIWLRTTLDLPFSLAKENLIYIGGVMAHETPAYVKRNSQIGAALIAPFFIFIIANSLAHHTLGQGRVSNDILRFLVIGLPTIAFLLGTATFVKWAAERHANQKVGYMHNLLDFRRNWPILATAGLGLLIVLFIFGHDSIHCLTDNPIRELQNSHQTLRCIQRG